MKAHSKGVKDRRLATMYGDGAGIPKSDENRIRRRKEGAGYERKSALQNGDE